MANRSRSVSSDLSPSPANASPLRKPVMNPTISNLLSTSRKEYVYNLFNKNEEEEQENSPEKEREDKNRSNQYQGGASIRENDTVEGVPRETSFISEVDVSMESASRNFSRADTPSHLQAAKGSPSKEQVNHKLSIMQKKEDTPEFKMSGTFSKPINSKDKAPSADQVSKYAIILCLEP